MDTKRPGFWLYIKFQLKISEDIMERWKMPVYLCKWACGYFRTWSVLRRWSFERTTNQRGRNHGRTWASTCVNSASSTTVPSHKTHTVASGRSLIYYPRIAVTRKWHSNSVIGNCVITAQLLCYGYNVWLRNAKLNGAVAKLQLPRDSRHH